MGDAQLVSYRKENTFSTLTLLGFGVGLACVGGVMVFTATRVTTLTCERAGGRVECVATEPAFMSSLMHPVAHAARKADVEATRHGARLTILGDSSVLELLSFDSAALEELGRELNAFFAGRAPRLTHQLVRERADPVYLGFYAVAVLSYLAFLVFGERRVRVTRPRAHQYVIEGRAWLGGSVLARHEFTVAPHVADDVEVVKQRVASTEYRTVALSDGERRLVLPAPRSSQVEAVRAGLAQLVR
jgi:hypothetical protein